MRSRSGSYESGRTVARAHGQGGGGLSRSPTDSRSEIVGGRAADVSP